MKGLSKNDGYTGKFGASRWGAVDSDSGPDSVLRLL